VKAVKAARFLFAAILASSAFAGPSLHAQSVERAVFLVRSGRDTLAVESATSGGGTAESSLALRGGMVSRVRRSVVFAPAGGIRTMSTTVVIAARGDSTLARSELTVTGDSGEVRDVGPAPASTVHTARVAVPAGAVPFINLSGQSLELILRRARATGRDTVVVPLFLGGSQSTTVRVTRVGADSMVMSLGGVDIRARTDGVGRLLGATVPSQGVVIERLPADSPARLWSPPSPAAAPVSYDAPPGAPYRAEEMTLHTPAGIKLAGTLTMPVHAAGTRLPAVVLITGSGTQDRDEASPMLNPSYRPFREIADTLSRRGIAVLRLDDRGAGGSDRGSATATSADFADDVRAALAWLRARADVDSARLGLVGHSEGGMIAPMIAATDPALHALVLIAGPAKTGRAIASYQRRYAIDHDPSIPPAKRDSIFVAAERASEAIYATPGWIRFWVDYDPLPTARRVSAPTLILQGETDMQVTPDQADLLASTLRAGGNRRVTVRTFPRMNHLMLDDGSGDPRGYGALPSYRVRRDLLGEIADWLARTL
jgi:alpha-beta hydrolase superfamily lysophospholipase